MSRDEKVIPLGIDSDGCLVLVTSFFDQGNGFRGVCGATLAPICQAYIDERRTPEAMAELYDCIWRDAVASEDTELGLDAYMEQMLESDDTNSEGAFPGHDTGYTWDIDRDLYLREYFPNCVDFECIGCGLMFSAESLARLVTVLDADLLARIRAQENI